jgi:hypothetical protein
MVVMVAAMIATVGQINSAAAVFLVQIILRYSVSVLVACQKARLLVVQESELNQNALAGRLDWAVLEFTTQIALQAKDDLHQTGFLLLFVLLR